MYAVGVNRIAGCMISLAVLGTLWWYVESHPAWVLVLAENGWSGWLIAGGIALLAGTLLATGSPWWWLGRVALSTGVVVIGLVAAPLVAPYAVIGGSVDGVWALRGRAWMRGALLACCSAAVIGPIWTAISQWRERQRCSSEPDGTVPSTVEG